MRLRFSNLGLRIQVATIVAVALTSLMVLGAVYLDGRWRQDAIMVEAQAAALFHERMGDLEVDLLQLRRDEKDFLARSDLSHARKHTQTRPRVVTNLASLRAGAGADRGSETATRLATITGLTDKYFATFDTLVEARTQLGLDPEAGLEGALRRNAHAIEKSAESLTDARVRVLLLQLRRHEKDYMLRHDDKSVADFDARVKEFGTAVAEIDMPAATRKGIDEALAAYRAGFLGWVEGDRRIAAVTKEISSLHRAIEPEITALEKIASTTAEAGRAAAAAVKSATEQRMIWVFAAVTGLLALLSWAIGRAIAGPVRDMTEVMDRLADGDLEVVVPGGDKTNEIGKMAHAVAIFRDNARERQRLEALQASEKQRVEAERRASMLEMADRFEHAVGGIVAAVGSAATQLQQAAQTLTASAEQTSAQAASVAAASEEASTNVETVAAATEELSATVGEIARQVQESVTIAGSAVSEATATNVRVKGLSDAADRIGGIVALINEIAGKTNLLALNATIEAARAGDAGRGFAVVAHEVKGLAEQTAKATAEIGSNIAAIQDSTSQAAEAIDAIGQTINRMNGIATSIASAVEEQGVTTQEIARNVQQAAAGSTSVTRNIGEVTDAATSSSAASAQVLSAASDLSRQAETMRSAVASFLSTIRAA